MNKILISCAYIYPLCPLNINHAKMFVMADVVARHERAKGKNVFFPIASHYSGNTAQKFSEIFLKNFLKNNLIDDEKKVFLLYKDFYNTPIHILKTFTAPLNILKFYNEQILWELKSLRVSCDYENFYTTDHEDYPIFVNTIISFYENNGLLVKNQKGDLALDYNSGKWKKEMLELANKTEFIQSFHKNNVISAIRDVRNDWGLLRKSGYGVTYKEWIIDPMFDSEIFTVFDLYVKLSANHKTPKNKTEFFKELFLVLKSGKKSEDDLINEIASHLPCDVLICEEHLKNWVIKKMYAESLLLHRGYQTRKYFILGMGFLNKKQMSSSKGNAILAKDLINNYGSLTARLVILLSGGHPSKMYNFDSSTITQARKLLNDFTSHYLHLLSIVNSESNLETKENDEFEEKISKTIEDNLGKYYYRQAVIELLSILPGVFYQSPSLESACGLLSVYDKYIEILLPELLDSLKVS